jgi:hypothetical protein
VTIQPDWSSIFEKFPELEAPGYQETLEKIRQRLPDYEAERLKAKMQQINKEKQGTRAKNRGKAAIKESATPDSADSLFSISKRRGKKR